MDRRIFVSTVVSIPGLSQVADFVGNSALAHSLGESTEQDCMIGLNPYDGVDWSGDGQYKADHHVHWRGFGDDPADTLDVLAGGAKLDGHALPEDDWYEVLGAGSQAEDEDPY